MTDPLDPTNQESKPMEATDVPTGVHTVHEPTDAELDYEPIREVPPETEQETTLASADAWPSGDIVPMTIHEAVRQSAQQVHEMLRTIAPESTPVADALGEDPVNHPSHYTSHPSGIECIAVTEHAGFNIGNAIKYLWRTEWGDKGDPAENLHKAVWYINRELAKMEGK